MQTILFIELLGGIGDVLIALPAIQALGRSHPDARLTVLTFAPGSELLKGDPLIHQVIGVEREALNQDHLARNTVEGLLERCTFDLIVSDTNYDGIGQTHSGESCLTYGDKSMAIAAAPSASGRSLPPTVAV